MAATNSRSQKHNPIPTVCILYGFCEGPRIGKQFEKTHTEDGFELTKLAYKANIIVAHSGGCFVLPDNSNATIIFMIGLSYATENYPGLAHAQKIIQDVGYHARSHQILKFCRKSIWNVIYFWRMQNNFRMLEGIKNRKWQRLHNIILIRNEDDVMCLLPDAELPFENKPEIIWLPGQHDDCWLHPQKYVDVIKSEYGKRVLAQAGE